ncbi:MAG: RNA polymerase sigma factor (sigma-70 family) [Cyclobacteriaceae bacterium]|jgi:RNA polymerase sigma factor (sigma-70 family)
MITNQYMLQINKSYSEEVLIADCLKGKQKAQKEMYERFAPKMLGVCMRYINDREEAEHVMIGGMVKVFEKLNQYTFQGSFEGWVRRVMVNESLMYIRRNKNMSLEIDVADVEHQLDFARLDDSLEAEDLMRLIELLPVGYRTVFNLYAIEGYSHKEIAEALAVSENTSKSQLSRARKLLQSQLASLQAIELDKNRNHGFKK